MKKQVLLLFCLLTTVFSNMAFGEEIDGINYVLDSETQTASVSRKTSIKKKYSGAVIIPSSVKYNGNEYTVTSIGNSAFDGCSSLKSIEIPNSVTSIGNGAFSSCSGLKSIDIPSSVISIGDGAFRYCSGLTTITIPNSVTYLNAFYGCSGLTTITIPNSVTYLSGFSGCTGLTSIEIPNSVTSIGNSAFDGCSSLKSIEIPNSVTSIGKRAFSSCSGLKSIDIPSSVISIGDGAFRYCSGLTTITIPNSVTLIGNNAFESCTNLTAAKIQCDISVPDAGAFAKCDQLETIYIDNAEEILTKFHILSEPRKKYFLNGEQITTITVPDGYESLTEQSFSNLSGIRSISFPVSLKRIDGRIDLFSVEKICCYATIPPEVTCFTEIGNDIILYVPYGTKAAYKAASGWKELPLILEMPNTEEEEEIVIALEAAGTLKEALSEIETTKIKHLTLKGPIDANDIKLIRAQEGRLSTLEVLDLKDVTLVPNDEVYYYSFGELPDATVITGAVTHYVYIGERDTSINESYGYGSKKLVRDYCDDLSWAFSGIKSLKRIVWPSVLNEIGWCALSSCSQLEEFATPSTINYVGAGAFAGCTDLRKIPTLKDVTWMGNSAFQGCESLTALEDNHVLDISALDTIPANAFECCSRINSFILAPNLKLIYGYAFCECTGIKTIDIPNNTQVTISPYAFYKCTALENVNIPTNKATICKSAFSNCTSLVNVTLSNEIANIAYGAFNGTPWYVGLQFVDGIKYINNIAMECQKGTTSLNFKEGTINIADFFYSNSAKITSISLPSTLQRIGCEAFISMNVANIGLPSSLKTIAEGAFQKSTVSSLDMPESLEEIGDNAFKECKQLTKAKFSSSVKKIGKDAFCGCSLETLTLPSNIEEIGEFAFSRNTSLLWVEYNVPQAEGSWIFDRCSALERVTIGECVKELPTNMFNGCSNLQKATFIEGVQVIHSSAFRNCTSIKRIELPNTLKTIGQDAFYGCKNLSSISIPNSVTEIGEGSFIESGLISIEIPNSVSSIGRNAFRDCINLSEITLDNSDEPLQLFDNGHYETFSDCPITTLYLGRDILCEESPFQGKKTLQNLSISNNVTYLSDFSGCTGLTSIEIPNSVTYLSGFSGCTGLTSIEIPNSVTYLSDFCFSGCTGLTSIEIPNSVTEIRYRVFSGCTGITSVIIPNNVESISRGAFYGCTNLTSIQIEDSDLPLQIPNDDYLNETFYNCPIATLYLGRDILYKKSPFQGKKTLQNLSISNNVTSIGQSTFEGCSGLTSVEIPNSVISIGNQAFRSCTGLTSITIPNSVTSIEHSAFWGCTGLTLIEISNSVTSIENYAFRDCVNLKTIILGFSLQSIGSCAFQNCSTLTDVFCYKSPSAISLDTSPAYNSFYTADIGNATLHVPSSLINDFKNAPIWKDFGNIVVLPTYRIIYYVDEKLYKVVNVEEYSTIPIEPAPIKEGYTFSGWSDIPDMMPAHDVEINGSFSINSYTLTYILNGDMYKSITMDYGSTIVGESIEISDGYTFSGWIDIPETMPAHDVTVYGTYSNIYKLIYMVDDVEYQIIEIEYGKEVNPIGEPSKEGYTFSGWNDLPETMPANDVTVIGSFSINSYKLTYMLDGVEYKTATIEYGKTITPESVPTKEGYSFSGWNDLPETMPANDVTVTGSYTINKYKIIYIVDGVEYGSSEIEYGAEVNPIGEPSKEGYTFSGWNDLPETMPAHDVTVSGTFKVNQYKVTFMYGDNVLTTIEVNYGEAIELPTSLNSERYTLVEWLDVPDAMPAHDITIYADYVDGINTITADRKDEQYIRISGMYTNDLKRGVNIIRTQDGKTMKVWVK